jgi:hypothetical protein
VHARRGLPRRRLVDETYVDDLSWWRFIVQLQMKL